MTTRRAAAPLQRQLPVGTLDWLILQCCEEWQQNKDLAREIFGDRFTALDLLVTGSRAAWPTWSTRGRADDLVSAACMLLPVGFRGYTEGSRAREDYLVACGDRAHQELKADLIDWLSGIEPRKL